MKEWLKYGNKVGVFLALLFIACFVWYWVQPVHQELHMQRLELSFFGYQGMNSGSFIFGLVQSYIWGYIGVALWHVANYCCSYCCSCCGMKD